MCYRVAPEDSGVVTSSFLGAKPGTSRSLDIKRLIYWVLWNVRRPCIAGALRGARANNSTNTGHHVGRFRRTGSCATFSKFPALEPMLYDCCTPSSAFYANCCCALASLFPLFVCGLLGSCWNLYNFCI